MTTDSCILEPESEDFRPLDSSGARPDRGGDGREREYPSRQDEFSAVVKPAIDYMNANFARPITLRDLSEITDCSPARIIRAFRKTIGITPHAWLIRRRVLQGKVLIELGVSIATAAAEVGFFDQTHFTRHFKKLHGHTPARYRSTLWSVLRPEPKSPRKRGAERDAAGGS